MRQVAGVRLGIMLQSVSAMACGLTIGFIYSWELTLLLLGFGPFMAIGGFVQMKVFTGNKKKDKEAMEDAGKVGHTERCLSSAFNRLECGAVYYRYCCDVCRLPLRQ